MDPLEVVARRAETASALLTAGVDVLGLERGGRQAKGSLGEALSWEPGVASSFYGAGASRPVLRGMEGYRVGVFDSGLSTGDLSASSPDHAVVIEPLFVREVVIHRGAAALLHGGGAIGGAVDTHPDFLPDRLTVTGGQGEVGAFYDTANEGWTGYLKGGYRAGPWAVRFGILERITEDYRIPGLARTLEYDVNNRIRLPPEVQGQVASNPSGRVPNTWTKTRVGAAGLGWIAENVLWQGAYQRYESRYGVPLDGHTHGNPFGRAGVSGPGPNDGVTIDLNQDRVLARAESRLNLGPLERAEVKAAVTRLRQQEHEGRFLSNDFRLAGGDLQVELAGESGPARLFPGLAMAHHDFTNRNISYSAGRADEDRLETGSTVASAFALAGLDLNRTQFLLGGRIDFQKAARKDRADFARTNRAASAVVEVVQPLFGPWKTVVSLGNTCRLPNADELYIEAPHGATGIFQIPNPDLTRERSKSAELLLLREEGRLYLSVGVYYRIFDGYIFLENQGFEVEGLTAHALVQRKAEFQGGEAEARWIFLTNTDRTGRIRLFADCVRATDTERNRPLPRMPPLRLGTSLEFSATRWTVKLDALRAFSQNRVPPEVFGTLAYQSPSKAYTLLTLRMEHHLRVRSGECTFSLQGSNLLNQEARQHTSFLKDVAPLPGRSLQLGIRLEF